MLQNLERDLLNFIPSDSSNGVKHCLYGEILYLPYRVDLKYYLEGIMIEDIHCEYIKKFEFMYANKNKEYSFSYGCINSNLYYFFRIIRTKRNIQKIKEIYGS